MSEQNQQAKQQELDQLRQRVSQLESELTKAPPHWQATEFYGMYYATTGFFLGMAGAITSLLFNVIGSSIVGKESPLYLIKVYLTFPLGEKALSDNFDTGVALAVGCCLYILTGMILGVPFQWILGKYAPNATLAKRMVIASIMGLALWVFNFYVVLSWLQPALFDGNWIVSLIPPWVAAATHLVFAWTMALLYPFGAYTPYRRQTEQS